MNKILILLFFFSINVALAKTAKLDNTKLASEKLYTDQEIELLKTKLSSKLESNLTSYLGKIKFSVFLKLNTNTIKPKSNGPIIGNELNSIYLLENQIIKEEVSLQDKSIANASVKVVVYEALNDSINKEIEEITTSTLDSIKTSVKVSYLESTRSFFDQATNESKDLISFIKGIANKHVPEVMRLIGVLIFALVAVFGVVIFALLLKGPLYSIAESFKNFTAKGGLSGKTNADKDKDKDGDKNKESLIIDHREASDKFKENLVIFKNILLDKPLEIANLVTKNEKNASGIKKLLPYVFEKKYCDEIKANFKETHFSLMENSGFNFVNNIDFFTWFDETIEALSMDVLKIKKNILSGIPDVQLGVIKRIPAPVFRSYLQDNANSASYHIIMDLLEGSDRSEFLKDLDLDEWKIAIDVNDISESEIMEEVEKIINFSSTSLRSNDVVSASEIHSSLIIPSLLSVIYFKKLKVQDDFLDSLSSISEDSIKSIREVFWAPRDILSVPQNVLKESMRKYDVEEKSMIIFSMPIDIGNFLIASAIDGKAKEIVQDNLKNPNSDFNEEKAEVLGAKFISNLLIAYKNGEFKLSEHAKTLSFAAKKASIVEENTEDDLDMTDDLDLTDEVDEDADAA
ncbi:MAG: hypothetical protein Q7U04_02895 [Bacteriovorax sp.]|nr:hypothetical protein [Bacteriovorax sp.]